MPRWFSEQEKEIIRKRLLEQGYKLFSAYGLKKTNIEEIARAGGISKGAFYSFYASKEALFFDVIEQVEERARGQILEMIDLPGPSPRARLLAVLKKAFALFMEMPILMFFTGSDFDLLARRIPAEKIQEHLASDITFVDEVIRRCQVAGIPILVQTTQIMGLLYPLVLACLQENAIGQANLPGNTDMLLELVAAYCVGEVELEMEETL
jgi:AcrR family transcriptional regulator